MKQFYWNLSEHCCTHVRMNNVIKNKVENGVFESKTGELKGDRAIN